MRFAYADPPYPGKAKRYYGSHPDYAGEVDHRDLIARLVADYPDGWVLSTDAASLQEVLGLCPPVRVAVWNVTNSAPPGNRGSWHWCWEPVIVYGGRADRAVVVRDVLACGNASGFAGGTITGQKPARFTRWILDLLGYRDGDTVDDLFPGSGACGREFAARAVAPLLPFA